tara:strand:- start:588 stop:833 length:246 start_codon:yes stop_codon:yes gene_type:complete
MIIILIAFLMVLSAYCLCLIGDYLKKDMIITLPLMMVFDALIIFTYYKIDASKFELASGILIGTISKIIVFLLYQKHLRNE